MIDIFNETKLLNIFYIYRIFYYTYNIFLSGYSKIKLILPIIIYTLISMITEKPIQTLKSNESNFEKS